MKIELDIVDNPVVSFKEKFRRENTNEIGQVINEQTAELMIQEFRKFLFLCAAKMAEYRRSNVKKLKPLKYNQVEG